MSLDVADAKTILTINGLSLESPRADIDRALSASGYTPADIELILHAPPGSGLVGDEGIIIATPHAPNIEEKKAETKREELAVLPLGRVGIFTFAVLAISPIGIIVPALLFHRIDFCLDTDATVSVLCAAVPPFVTSYLRTASAVWSVVGPWFASMLGDMLSLFLINALAVVAKLTWLFIAVFVWVMLVIRCCVSPAYTEPPAEPLAP